MKKQILLATLSMVLSLNVQAQSSPNALSTSSESLLSLESYEFGSMAFLGGWGSLSGGGLNKYLGIMTSGAHKDSKIGYAVSLNFNQLMDSKTNETINVFDNPVVSLTKAWPLEGSFFDEIQGAISTTLPGNQGAYDVTYGGSISPSARVKKDLGRVSWQQVYSYSRGFFRQNSLLNAQGETTENVLNVFKIGQALGYQLTENFVVSVYGHALLPITQSGSSRGRVLGCLGGEYKLSKLTSVGFGYGSGTNFLSRDPMSDQLSYFGYSETGFAELVMVF